MSNKKLLSVGICVVPLLFAAPAHSALLTGTLLTIDQGSGDCSYSTTYGYNCTNLAGSYMMTGWSNGPTSFSPSNVAFLGDGYDDTSGMFVGGAVSGAGLMVGTTQPYQGAPVGPGMPYDPTSGQNITNAFQMMSGGVNPGPDAPWGTLFSTSPFVTNDGAVDFTGLSGAWGENPAVFEGGWWEGNGLLILIPGGGAFGAGRYALDLFAEQFIGEFENIGFLLHLEGSVNPVPIPAAIWLFGSGLLGLMRAARRKLV
ncbi:MAG: hypothetical protein HZB57_00280 [Gammaproteobacteria bacterium]|nr:hypothetical protein [Gammaproteobacteria bacterium]